MVLLYSHGQLNKHDGPCRVGVAECSIGLVPLSITKDNDTARVRFRRTTWIHIHIYTYIYIYRLYKKKTDIPTWRLFKTSISPYSTSLLPRRDVADLNALRIISKCRERERYNVYYRVRVFLKNFFFSVSGKITLNWDASVRVCRPCTVTAKTAGTHGGSARASDTRNHCAVSPPHHHRPPSRVYRAAFTQVRQPDVFFWTRCRRRYQRGTCVMVFQWYNARHADRNR